MSQSAMHQPETMTGITATPWANLPHPVTDRRRSERRPQPATAWLSSAHGQQPMHVGRTVTVQDLSLHGVGFVSPKPCEVGEEHWMIIAQGPMRLSTRARIVSSRPRADGLHEVGAEFF